MADPSLIFDPEIDRRRARFASPAKRLLSRDDRRVAIVGARGWIGRTAISLFHEALGAEIFARRVVCFGSTEALIDLGDGHTVRQRPLADLSSLRRSPTLLLHLAFQTKDKIAGMDAARYEAGNRAVSLAVHEALDIIGVDRLFVASSGAAAFVHDPTAPSDLRLYGRLKREDEFLFSAWGNASPGRRRAAIGRIYNVSGPWINKHQTYALASFLLDALLGRSIKVEARRPVLRGYVAVRELMSVILIALLATEGKTVLQFETGGAAMELADVAEVVAGVLGSDVLRAPIEDPKPNRYVGDDAEWQRLLGQCGVEHLSLADQVAETAAWLAREAKIPLPQK